jgi:hypothetical protein
MGLALFLAWSWFSGAGRRLKPLGFFLGFYGCVLLVWPRLDLRYLYPAIPALAIFLAAGLQAASDSGAWARRAARTLAAAMVSVAVVSCAGQALERIQGRGPQLPWETFGWMRRHLSRQTVVGSSSSATVYFYSGLQGIEFLRHRDPERLLGELRARGAGAVLLERSLLGWDPKSPPADVTNWSPFAAQALIRAGAQALYSNETEGTLLLRTPPLDKISSSP